VLGGQEGAHNVDFEGPLQVRSKPFSEGLGVLLFVDTGVAEQDV
jgi:hypothetical protein